MKFILMSSVYDKDRYRREPESFYDAEDYIEEHLISELLIDSINSLTGKEPAGKKEEKVEKTPETVVEREKAPKDEPKPRPEEKRVQPSPDEKIERARRLARTIVSDIYLYNTAKADEAIRNNTFHISLCPGNKGRAETLRKQDFARRFAPRVISSKRS